MRHKTKIRFNPSVIAVYFSVFIFVIAMIFVGYREPKVTNSVANAVEKSQITEGEESLVDNVVATTVAAGVAQSVNLPIANSVSNLAITTRITSKFAQNDTSEVVKPQIINSENSSRSITNYKVKSGDTVDSLAKKFGISEQTIKWANNLTGNGLIVGSTLKILPVDGVLYTVQAGDTIDSLAERYGVNKTRLVLFNDLDVSGLKLGGQIILPEATLPTEERPGYVVHQNYYNISFGYDVGDNVVYLNNPGAGQYLTGSVKALIPHIKTMFEWQPGYFDNKMAPGNCTWWAWERRKALGRPLPFAVLGNGGVWRWRLIDFGYSFDKTPKPGDVFEQVGHVGIVERLNRDSRGNIVSLTTSEMNWGYRTYQVVERTIPASAFYNFDYIH